MVYSICCVQRLVGLTCCRQLIRVLLRIMAAMRIRQPFGASVAHVVAGKQDGPQAAILTRKLGAIEKINSDLEVRGQLLLPTRKVSRRDSQT